MTTATVTPTAIRDEVFRGLQDGLTKRRQEVYDAWLAQGPATTRELAVRADLALLSVCPRTTELLQMGLLECVGRRDGCGVYRARPIDEAVAVLVRARSGGEQMRLL